MNETGLEEHTGKLRVREEAVGMVSLGSKLSRSPKKQSQRAGWAQAAWLPGGMGWQSRGSTGMPVRQWETTGCGAELALAGEPQRQ